MDITNNGYNKIGVVTYNIKIRAACFSQLCPKKERTTCHGCPLQTKPVNYSYSTSKHQRYLLTKAICHNEAKFIVGLIVLVT